MLFSITIQITSDLIELLLSKKRGLIYYSNFCIKASKLLFISKSGCIVNIDVRH